MLSSTATRVTILISYRMPCLILYNLKRPCVNIKNHLIFAFEILWYLPQVLQAVAASAVLEFTGFEYISCFI
jgi:hypothetical protein